MIVGCRSDDVNVCNGDSSVKSDNEPEGGGVVKSQERFIAVILYELSRDSSRIAFANQLPSSGLVSYSKSLTVAYLNGVFHDIPLNGYVENHGVDVKKYYQSEDPLGWLDSLNEGCKIKVKSDPNLIVLYKDVKTDYVKDGRDVSQIVDVVPYKNLDYFPDGVFNYTTIGKVVLKKSITAIDEVKENLLNHNK